MEPIRRGTTKKILGHGGTGQPTPPPGGVGRAFVITAPSARIPEKVAASPSAPFVNHIKSSLQRAHRKESHLDEGVLKIHGFSTPTMRRFFNNLLRMGRPVKYVEVGLYCGGTYCAALSNNPEIQAWGFEDFSQPFDVSDVKEQCLRNVRATVGEKADWGSGFIEKDFFQVPIDEESPTGIDVFFYDGNHDYEWQSKALPRMFDQMADTFIFIVDDIAWNTVDEGTKAGFAALADRMTIIHHWELFGQSKSDDPIWHNGLGVFLCRKKTLSGPTFLHNGDIGDAIASLPVIRALGGGHLVFTQGSAWRNPRPFHKSSDLLTPLIKAQPYIRSVRWEEYPGIVDFDLCMFRQHQKRGGRTLIHEQSTYLGIAQPDISPWLTAKADLRAAGRVIVARSPRYQNPLFPWKKVAEKYGDRMLFVGLDAEYGEFKSVLGRSVERYNITDFLDLAQMIKGSDLFIGNQSSPVWVAMGLGHPLIQETSPHVRNSIVRNSDHCQFVDGKIIQYLP